MSCIFVVTGSNKGIGYGIVKSLAQKVQNGMIYLTARNVELGETSLNKVNEELGVNKKSEIIFHQLDITDENSCKTFANYLKKKHGGLDVLINNAGFAFPNAATESAEEQAIKTIGINYYGTKLVSSILQPLIRNSGRVVNVCSQMGIMDKVYSREWIQKFQNVQTEQEIDDFVEQYKIAAKNNNRKERGFPESAYRVSKTAEIAYTLLQSHLLANRNIIVNGCCPGYVSTDMTNFKGPLSIAEGTDTPVFLAIEPEGPLLPRGQFVYLRKAIKWNSLN